MALEVINPRKIFNFRGSNYFVQSKAKRKKERKKENRKVNQEKLHETFWILV